jgi:hypothetical protein
VSGRGEKYWDLNGVVFVNVVELSKGFWAGSKGAVYFFLAADLVTLASLAFRVTLLMTPTATV